MKDRFTAHIFWGSYSPFSLLTGTALVILASSRLSFALICAGAIIWVYGLTSLVFSAAVKILPVKGKKIILLFLSAFICGIFMILIGLINPLLIFGMVFFLFLIPPCLLGSGLFDVSMGIDVDIEEAVSRAVMEGLMLSAIIVAFALIREPLGMGTLSFPGGAQGIVEVFGSVENDNYVPIRVLSASAGGLLLFGYAMALFRYFRSQKADAERDNREEER